MRLTQGYYLDEEYSTVLKSTRRATYRRVQSSVWRGTDEFLMALSPSPSRSRPSWHPKERGRRDRRFRAHIHGKKFAIYGDPDSSPWAHGCSSSAPSPPMCCPPMAGKVGRKKSRAVAEFAVANCHAYAGKDSPAYALAA